MSQKWTRRYPVALYHITDDYRESQELFFGYVTVDIDDAVDVRMTDLAHRPVHELNVIESSIESTKHRISRTVGLIRWAEVSYKLDDMFEKLRWQWTRTN